MKFYNNILETIGNTPLVKLNVVTKDVKATVLAKDGHLSMDIAYAASEVTKDM